MLIAVCVCEWNAILIKRMTKGMDNNYAENK